MAEEKKLSFEQAMDQLESIVEKLEEGDVPLEEAISFYKEGMELSKLCHDKLKNVEEQLAQIITEDGRTESFSINEEE
ncbi:exodeoxyribonuclease VII small subunit [Mesobacillus sp. AQ2]|jgi:exodeoxyribonuclease VII small subunit|uniref:exodeoxyribonuclease VII small subunit n=1 Tax=Bacillaceae TaxID=186817 RepID=UPI0011A39CA2|nr:MULTISPECIES: exodeoxyribonuclease VII small subunit [Bacillaceae]MBT2702047.1 exodeoxyribonuclease VII small subunit [Chryseobacterium sp. ISL-80]MBT2677565.1 exodeoxyribonuclease VII small subunit [Bacillus sp. ISL-35]MCM3122345.1 exodeoxyribonuclease VII small subunit [Mesobacillus sp. MER 33]MCM3232309.1 exodeoxyribonuclease VII small subunit [Mesobacillus sp. MER 48]WHX39254.1 exodeoxyribonuclease VII small subunit [Mesobacillus sp. AQ2]